MCLYRCPVVDTNKNNSQRLNKTQDDLFPTTGKTSNALVQLPWENCAGLCPSTSPLIYLAHHHLNPKCPPKDGSTSNPQVA